MIKHILKDGTIKQDLTGHIVKYQDAKQFYDELKKGNPYGNHQRTKSAATVRGRGNQ